MDECSEHTTLGYTIMERLSRMSRRRVGHEEFDMVEQVCGDVLSGSKWRVIVKEFDQGRRLYAVELYDEFDDMFDNVCDLWWSDGWIGTDYLL